MPRLEAAARGGVGGWTKIILTTSLVWLAAGSPAFGDWPERDLTLVVSVPHTLPWGEAVNPQSTVLGSLGPRLSRELGVPVNVVNRAEGYGVLAANAVSLARDDGYVLTALGNDPAINLVIQGYTPYTWGELSPVATAWREVYVLVARRDYPAADFLTLAESQKKGDGQSGAPKNQTRLAVVNLEPLSSAALMAMEAARAAGFDWLLTKVDRLDPELLLAGQADSMVIPLAYLKAHPRRDELRVLLVFSRDEPIGAEGWPTLKSQGLEVATNPFFAFYLPPKVSWRIRQRLSTAINNTLRLKAVSESLIEAGLTPYLEDSEGVGAILNQEYGRQARLLESFGRLEPLDELEPAAYK